jgi:hypothetical protein
MATMTNPDDKHDDKREDQQLAAWLDGRDGVSAAYRQTAREEPPPALDRKILQAARDAVQPQAPSHVARPVYALAASVMVAVVGLSLYIGSRDDMALQQEKATEQRVTETFEQRQLTPTAPTVSAGAAVAPAPPPAAVQRTEAFARSEEAPATVIDGPLLEQIEAEAARAGAVATQREQIVVTGSRIVRLNRDEPAYRASRDEWLAEMRAIVAALERSTSQGVSQRDTTELQRRLEDEIDHFLVAYPNTNINAELGLPER